MGVGIKPKITKSGSWWKCEGLGKAGYGLTPAIAYKQWQRPNLEWVY